MMLTPAHAPARGSARSGVGTRGRVVAATTGCVIVTKEAGRRIPSSSASKNSRASSCALARISFGELIGASIRFVSHAMSYNSAIAWRAKYAATSRSIAASVSSSVVFGENVSQSTDRTISVSTSPVRVSRLARRALPPRRPKLTKPSRVGQISRVLPMFAPRRTPRNPVRGNVAGVAMLATAITSCIDTSICCGRPLASPVSAANAVSAAAWA